MEQTNSRKRPAPGASPLAQQVIPVAPQQYPYQPFTDNTDFTNFNFPTDQNFSDPSAFDSNNFAYSLNTAQQPQYGAPQYASTASTAPSTDLVRRSQNQQLMRPANGQQEQQWNGTGTVGSPAEEEDEQDLDNKVAMAKKDAQGKRKQIPPFVQKLSSFLDSSHTDLIRWSDDGRSFIVLDEDEFARTLIPELFKHNNYASFVRQLNMYGFHKTVNITDGSLRQSEQARTGVKPPSMYSHPYFRRDRPDLLWLILKPVSGKSTKRKRDGTIKDGYDSDEGSPGPELGGLPQQISTSGTSQDLAHLPRNELVAVRRELQNLQTQQKFISQMITQLQEQNDQFYRQATAFQNLHDRHEKSINAILTFLATFYNNSLEGGSAQNLVNMFTKAMPQAQQGSVVEEYNDPATPTADNQVQRFVKKTPLLLPGPASSTQNLQPGSAVTEPNSARGSATPPNDISNRGSLSSAPPENARLSNASAASPAVKTDAATPNYLQQVPESTDDMMNLINNVNASKTQPNSLPASSAVDMSSLVDRINQNNSPLTPQQREDMVANFASTSNSNANPSNPVTTAANALTNASSSTNPAAFTDSIGESRSTLDYLQQLQKQQDARVQELNRRLVPLSPTGTIPGLAEYGSEQNPFDTYNPGEFINFDDPAPWEHGNGDGGAGGDGDFDFNFDGNGGDWGDLEDNGDIFDSVLPGLKEYEGVVEDSNGKGNATADQGGDNAGAGRVESVSSAAASPLVTNLPDEPERENDIGTPKKRARRF